MGGLLVVVEDDIEDESVICDLGLLEGVTEVTSRVRVVVEV